jgi:hypothetical protein
MKVYTNSIIEWLEYWNTHPGKPNYSTELTKQQMLDKLSKEE